MSFSNYSGIAIVPTLSRIVLCAAFITAGYAKVFTTAEFSHQDAQILDNLGVSLTHVPPPPPATAPATAPAIISSPPTTIPPVEKPPVVQTPPATVPVEVPPVEPPPVETPPDEDPSTTPPATEPESETELAPESPDDPPPSAHMNATFVLAAYQQPQPAQPRSPGRLRPASASTQPAAQPQPAKPSTKQPAKPASKLSPANTAPALAPGTYQASSMHHITVMLSKLGWSYPRPLAIAAAWTEFLGGALLLIGLFSRLCGLSLAGVMVVAFYLTSLQPLLDANFMLLNMQQQAMSTMLLQLALFVLAFGIFLTGPGPLSIDRFLFGSPREVIEVEDTSDKL